jgi:hypothetical protein
MSKEVRFILLVALGVSVLFNAVFIAEHVYLITLNVTHPMTIDPNPPCHLVKP